MSMKKIIRNSENLAKVDGVEMVCILEGVLKAAMLKGLSLLPPARICMRHPSTQKNLFCGRMICFDQSWTNWNQYVACNDTDADADRESQKQRERGREKSEAQEKRVRKTDVSKVGNLFPKQANAVSESMKESIIVRIAAIVSA